jgi:hypothetical protein
MDLPDPPPSRIAVLGDPRARRSPIFEGETDD